MAAIWKKLAARPQGDLNMFKKVSLSFLFVGLALGLSLFAPNVETAITPIKSDTYFFGAYLLTKELRSGEKHISPTVITVENKNGHNTLARAVTNIR